jgi:hypothetical protein
LLLRAVLKNDIAHVTDEIAVALRVFHLLPEENKMNFTRRCFDRAISTKLET